MRVVILGVGNEMRGDDGIGVFLAGKLEKELGKPEGIMIIKTQVPENFITPIMEFRPGKIIILDSADFKGKPGEFRVIKEDEILQFLHHFCGDKDGSRVFERLYWFPRQGAAWVL